MNIIRLNSIIDNQLFNHPLCFDAYQYSTWEHKIATPAIENKDLTVLRWFTLEGDSFGPLTRNVYISTPNKKIFIATYS